MPATATSRRLSQVTKAAPEIVATAILTVDTDGPEFIEITEEAARFIAQAGARDGALLVYLRHTSASLVIQENADPNVRTDLAMALERLAPPDAGWVHMEEGPDDMPSHVKTMLTGVSLQIPIMDAKLALGHWQGIYLAEHRRSRRRREIVLQFIGSCR
jgi:secondary thiamine-phosphate synthase enzyme